jgi:hypothetical protein
MLLGLGLLVGLKVVSLSGYCWYPFRSKLMRLIPTLEWSNVCDKAQEKLHICPTYLGKTLNVNLVNFKYKMPLSEVPLSG